MANTVLFVNNYQTTLGAALSSTATTMTVSSATGLPSSLSGQFIPITLTPASSPGSVYEIVYVTAISGTTLTITRGEEGTSALSWNVGDILYSTNTAQTTGTSTGNPNTAFQASTIDASGLIMANGGITAGGTTTVDTLTVNSPLTANDGISTTTLDASGLITANGGIDIPNASAGNNPVAYQQSIGGTAQSYVDQTSNRALGTTYTNNTGRPLFVVVNINIDATQSEGAVGYINGNQVAEFSNPNTSVLSVTISLIVPPGNTYEFTVSSGGLNAWYEY